MISPYYKIEQMLEMIEEPNRTACQRIFSDNLKLFQSVQGSRSNHQDWPGGYLDHVQEGMNIAIPLYGILNSLRPLPFSLSDLLLVVYLHDIEKPWKYELDKDGRLHYKPGMREKEDHHRFRMAKFAEYGIVLTPEQKNGIDYAEAELKNYSGNHRAMGPLACLVHMCDVCSARLWFDHPLKNNDDPWLGARRFRLM